MKRVKARSFEDARKYAQSLHLNFNSDWKKLHKQGKIPKDIPKYVNETYAKQGWKSWGDFLGTGNLSPSDKRKQMRSYEECKKFVRSLEIKTEIQWREWCRNNERPIDIPYSFKPAYPNEWISMGEFLGTGFVADKNKIWRPFEEARTIVQKLGFKNRDDYNKAWKSGKIPEKIPKNPREVYKNKGWKNFGDWLETGKITNQEKAKNYLSFKEAGPIYKKLAKQYGLKNDSDWKKFTKTHKKLLVDLRLPARPRRVYSKERVWKKMK